MLIKTVLVVSLLLGATVSVSAEDTRQHVELPAPMRAHMLANMRDHLLALEIITRQLANRQYDKAAEVAEKRLGMSSMQAHGASHIAEFMPEEMAKIGTEMHRAASRFSIAAQNADVDGGLGSAFATLSEVMQQCVACHAGYRVH